MFEVAVVTAPALVAGIVAVASPEVAVIVGAVLGVRAALGFTATHASRALARRRATRSAGSARWSRPGCARFLVLARFGIAVGIVQVAVPAFAAARGSAATGGVLLAALSAGSLAGGARLRRAHAGRDAAARLAA